jgi:hypothetical protein
MFGMTFSPWIMLGVVLGGLGLGTIGYVKGDADAANRYQIKIDKLQTDATAGVQKTRDALMAQANEAVASKEDRDEKARIVYRTITEMVDKIVDRPVYRNVCLDDDGLRLANAALGGVAVSPAAVGGAAPGMPRSLAPQ